MSAAGHTPGPWRIKEGHYAGGVNHLAVLGCDRDNAPDNMPASITPLEWARPIDYANARLIAAAPELLAGLEQVLHWIDCDCDPSKHSLEAARAAIAKAKGRP